MSGGWEQYVREIDARRQFLRRAGLSTVVIGAGPRCSRPAGVRQREGRDCDR